MSENVQIDRPLEASQNNGAQSAIESAERAILNNPNLSSTAQLEALANLTPQAAIPDHDLRVIDAAIPNKDLREVDAAIPDADLREVPDEVFYKLYTELPDDVAKQVAHYYSRRKMLLFKLKPVIEHAKDPTTLMVVGSIAGTLVAGHISPGMGHDIIQQASERAGLAAASVATVNAPYQAKEKSMHAQAGKKTRIAAAVVGAAVGPQMLEGVKILANHVPMPHRAHTVTNDAIEPVTKYYDDVMAGGGAAAKVVKEVAKKI